MKSRINAFQANHSSSIHLLSNHSLANSRLHRYQQLMDALKNEGEFLFFETELTWLSCYERDAQRLNTQLPLLVFRPNQMISIPLFIQMCRQLCLSITIRCGGTGLAGGSVTSKEGVILLTGHFKQIHHYDSKHGNLCIEPGVTIRQINEYVKKEGWFFPLKMASEGVAGLAGCLSCQARGYHQQEYSFFDAIESVSLIDGQGHILKDMPGSLVCGAEGLWGIIIEMKLRLKRRPSQHLEYLYTGSWQEILLHLSLLKSLQSLSFIVWKENHFYLGVEGESWRLSHAYHYLKKYLNSIALLNEEKWISSLFFMPTRHHFLMISSVFSSWDLPKACSYAQDIAQQLQLECLEQADVLAGSLHLILQTQENKYFFSQKIEQFLILWANFVDQQQGSLVGCHGVGMQMRSYMTPFWSEETQQIWQRLKNAFDPYQLIGTELFFPPLGKSLERLQHEFCF